MKIGKVKITEGPNIQWWMITILAFLLGGWKGLLLWTAFNITIFGIQLLVDEKLRKAVFGEIKKE